jgi:hypothetical protein
VSEALEFGVIGANDGAVAMNCTPFGGVWRCLYLLILSNWVVDETFWVGTRRFKVWHWRVFATQEHHVGIRLVVQWSTTPESELRK